LIYLNDAGDECDCEECRGVGEAPKGGLDSWLAKRYDVPKAPLPEGSGLDPWEDPCLSTN
jgi:hypothetical protein